MPRKRKSSREKDLTSRFLKGDFEEDRVDSSQRFNKRNKFHQQNKIARTTEKRLNDVVDVSLLPIGRVLQVYSLYVDVWHEGRVLLATVRKTLHKVSDTSVVVGDYVRFSPADQKPRSEDRGTRSDKGSAADNAPESPDNAHQALAEVRETPSTSSPGQRNEPVAVIESIEPRATILTRSDSFKAIEQHPIVANAEQMLIVASLAYPTVKWGLIDRMLIAAQAGGLKPFFCLNKTDVAEEFPHEAEFAAEAMALYRSIGIECIETSVNNNQGLDRIREILHGKVTILAGHSGVGKSSLIQAIEPNLDIRIGAISNFNQKGRHTTTSAKIYPLSTGGDVIDTPGVKLFGLWNVTRDNLLDFFPDIEGETAPEWRRESYARIEASLSPLPPGAG